jgi:hypothetical protein
MNSDTAYFGGIDTTKMDVIRLRIQFQHFHHLFLLADPIVLLLGILTYLVSRDLRSIHRTHQALGVQDVGIFGRNNLYMATKYLSENLLKASS